MPLFSNIIYVLATGCLLTGTILTFNKDELSDYFYLSGTSLFVIKSIICFYNDLKVCVCKSNNHKSYYQIIQ